MADGQGEGPEARDLFDRQQQDALTSWFKVKAHGGDPLSESTLAGTLVHPRVQFGLHMMELMQHKARIKDALSKSEWSTKVAPYYGRMIEQWRARKNSSREQDPGPMVEDENELADIRQAIVKANNAVRAASGGKTNLWNLEETKDAVAALATDTQGIVEGAPQRHRHTLGSILPMGTLEFAEGAADLGVMFVKGAYTMGEGMVQIGSMGLDSLMGGNGDYVWTPPSKMIRDPKTGELLHNGSKINGIADVMSWAWAHALGKDADTYIRDVQDAREWERASRNGLETVVFGLSKVAGMFSPTGFMTVAGKMMHRGGQVSSHLLLRGGLKTVASNGTRWGTMTKKLSELPGAMVTQGSLEATAFGEIDGYGKAFLGGAVMALPILAIGAMGRRTEWLLRNRKNMPARIKQALDGAVQGAGLGVLEATTTDSLWEFLKTGGREPLAELGQNFLINILGGAIGRAANRPHPEPMTGVRPETAEASRRADAELSQPSRVRPTEMAGAIARSKKAKAQGEVEKKGFDRTEAERRMEAWKQKEAPPEVAEKAGEARRADVERIKERAERKSEPKPEEPDTIRKEPELRVEGPDSRGYFKVVQGNDVLMAGASEAGAKGYIEFRRPKTKPETTGPESERRTETVEGREGQPIKGEKLYGEEKVGGTKEFQAKFPATGDPAFKPERLSPEEQLWQFGGKEGLGPDIIKEKTSRDVMAEKRKEGQQGFDPLEEATFMARPEAERRAILERRGAQERRKTSEGFAGPDPRTGADRRKFNRREWELLRDVEAAPEAPRLEAERRGGERRQADEGPYLPGGLDRRIGERRQGHAHPEHAVDPDDDKEKGGGVPRGTSEPDVAFSQGGRGPGFERMPIEGVLGAPDIRQSDIRLEMEGFEGDPIRATIRPGRIAQKFAAGLAKTREDLIRTQDDFDNATLAHEWAHLMQKKTVGMRHLWDPATNADLIRIGAPVAGNAKGAAAVAEGFAEFWARHALGDPLLQSEAPNAFKTLTQWMAATPGHAAYLGSVPMEGYARQYKRIRDAIQNWKDLGALRRSKSLVTEPDKPSKQEIQAGLKGKRAAVSRAAQTFSQTMVDDVANLKAREKNFYERAGIDPTSIPIGQHTTRLFDAYRMRTRSIAEGFMRSGTIDLKGNRTGKSFEEVLEPIKADEVSDFMSYMLGLKSLDLHSKGQKTILPIEDHLAVVDKLDRPSWRQAARDVTDYFGRVLDYTVEAGARTEAEAQAIKDNMGVWLPMLKTMSRNLKDPVQAMADVTASMIARAHDSMVRKAMVMQSVRLDKVGGLVTPVPKEAIPQQFQVKELMKAIEKADVPSGKRKELEEVVKQLEEVVDKDVAESIATLFRPELMPKKGEAIIAHKVAFTEAEIAAESNPRVKRWMKKNNGKELFFEMDPEAHQALMGLEDPHIAMFGHLPTGIQAILRAPAQVVRFGATVTSLPFQLSNLVKDALSYGAYTKTKAGIIPFAGVGAAIQGATHIAKNSPEWQRYLALGGAGETLTSKGFFEGKARPLLKGSKHPASVVRMLTRKLIDVMNVGEQIPRVREFAEIHKEAIEAGKPELEATQLAMEASREVTLNFTRGGSVARVVNQVTPYFTANIAGKRKMWRTLFGMEGDKARTQFIYQAVTQFGSLTALTYLLHGDEEWYRALPEWQRRNYWNLKNPFTGSPIKIPKGDIGQLISVPFEMGLDYVNDQSPVDAKDFLIDFIGGHFGGFALIPSIILPSAETAANYKFFSGHNIVPFWTERTKPTEEQFTSATTETAKILGQSFGVSPAKLEHWIGGTTGGLSTRIFRTLDWIAGASKTPALSLENVPGLGAFAGKPEFHQSRSVDRLYDEAERLQQQKGVKALNYKDDFKRKALNRALEEISAIRKAGREGRMTKDQANRRMHEIARDALKRYEDASK